MTGEKSAKDLLAGLIFLAIGLAFGYAALGYELGSALRMGPGYFPIILAGILVLLGIAILVQSFWSGPDEVAIGTVPWRGMILLLGALVFFGMTVRGLGLLPSLFVTVFMSAWASRSNSLLASLVLAAGLTLLCWVIFVWALGLPLQIVGPWLPL